MRLSQIRIKNFRSFKDSTISLDRYTCLVGPNGSGKSTILQALNVFFRNTSSASTNLHHLSNEDFHHKNTNNPIKITLTFEELSPEAQKDLKAYYRSGKLVISAIAEWDSEKQSAEVKQHGSRLVMKAFSKFFDAQDDKAKVAELKGIYKNLKNEYPDLSTASTKADMETALREYEENHSDKCELVQSKTQFYGWSKGENLLRKYLQWIYVPSVKDASSEQEEGRNTALGQLLARTVRTKVDFQESINQLRETVSQNYKEIIQKEQYVLDNLSASLTSRIREWTHPGTRIELEWYYNPDKSLMINEPLARLEVGEHDFIGEIARLGHGLQRTVFVSLLQELADSDEQSESTLILGFEEPELYQHPPQARHMSSVLETLSGKNSQIILSTHSPYFVSSKGFENIRMVRKSKDDMASKLSHATYDEISETIAKALGKKPVSPTAMLANIAQIMQPSQNELYFANIVILVEGIEDIAYLSTYLQLSGRWDDFRKCGCHFVVTSGKTSMSRPLAVAKALDIPVFVVFDADADAKEDQLANHARDNKCIMSLCGIDSEEALPEKTLYLGNAVIWQSNILAVVKNDFGIDKWQSAEENAKSTQGYTVGKNRKNILLIAATLEELYEKGERSNVLDRACAHIIEYAEKYY